MVNVINWKYAGLFSFACHANDDVKQIDDIENDLQCNINIENLGLKQNILNSLKWRVKFEMRLKLSLLQTSSAE